MAWYVCFNLLCTALLLFIAIVESTQNCGIDRCTYGAQFCDELPVNNGRCQSCKILSSINYCDYRNKSEECLLMGCRNAEIEKIKEDCEAIKNNFTIIEEQNRDKDEKIENLTKMMRFKDDLIVRNNKEISSQKVIIRILPIVGFILGCIVAVVVVFKENLIDARWKQCQSSALCCGSNKGNMLTVIVPGEQSPEKEGLIENQTPQEDKLQAYQKISSEKKCILVDQVENQEYHNTYKTIEDNNQAKEKEIYRTAVPDSRSPMEASAPPPPAQTNNLPEPIHQVNQPAASEIPQSPHLQQQRTDLNQTQGVHVPATSYHDCTIINGNVSTAVLSKGHNGNANINPLECRRDCDEQNGGSVTRARMPTECSENLVQATYNLQPPLDMVRPDHPMQTTNC
ncbi:uncharacterized protein LOC126811714 [Patella vulgata]|uniref:uncharacterized protein LOC126811714 n=1 Tax=Patella vulgata TaxID=6465 RepID=UPI002180709F|nr:uncharacterized protein LOC126811714 [Patella vulgata]